MQLNILFPMLAASVLMAGKYSWETASFSYSVRSYSASLYFFILFFSVFLPILKLAFNEKKARTLWAVCLIIYSIPTHWLGLDKAYYQLNLKNAEGSAKPLHLDWFFNGYHYPTIPNEIPFFVFLIILGFCFIHFVQFKESKQRNLFAFVWILIVLQCWLHLSLRSPYTYIPHFEQPAEIQSWYHSYLFDNFSGAVNLDYNIFRSAEQLFHGAAREITLLGSRAFPEFLTAPFTYFFNSYYVFLAFNCMIWLIGVMVFYFFSLNYFSGFVSVIASLLLASGQGLILYVAQPKTYVFGIIGAVLMLSLFLICFQNKKKERWVLFGVSMGLILLCYDAQPWLLALFVFGILNKFNVKKNTMALILAFSVYYGFICLLKLLPQVLNAPTLVPLGGHPMDNILQQVTDKKWGLLFGGIERSARGFFECLIRTFQWVFLPAFLGILFYREKNRFQLWTIFLPAIATFSFFEFGLSFYTRFPRIVYSAYPAVYLFAAFGLYKVKEWLLALGFRKTGQAIVVVFLLWNFIWLNLDAFGFPVIYFAWFFRNTGFTPELF